jgi:tRNA(His) 5'-end guanylyltransferase
MINDSLGDRIKRYEAVTQHVLTPNSPVLIRVDGKAFHTWTRGMNRPFDHRLIEAMRTATCMTGLQMQGFKLAYTQSDEATFLITDTDSHETQGWFGYELGKIVSITASVFTAYFNREFDEKPPAFFDARAFTVPAADVPNVFVWRQKDWARNSIQMLARATFSHKELEGKRIPEIHEMLHGVGINWADLSPYLKNGTFVGRAGEYMCDEWKYDDVLEYLNAQEDQ